MKPYSIHLGSITAPRILFQVEESVATSGCLQSSGFCPQNSIFETYL